MLLRVYGGGRNAAAGRPRCWGTRPEGIPPGGGVAGRGCKSRQFPAGGGVCDGVTDQRRETHVGGCAPAGAYALRRP